MDLLERLLGHDRATTTELLALCARLPEKQLDQQFDIGWRSLRGILGHMVRNVEIWTDLMLERSPRTGPAGESLAELRGRFEHAYAEFGALARRVQAEGQLDALWIDVLDRPPRQKSYGGGIAHVITHNMHHRAALIHVLRRLGVPGVPEGDLIGWEQRLGGVAKGNNAS